MKEALAHYHRALQLLQPHQSDPAVTELVIMVRPTPSTSSPTILDPSRLSRTLLSVLPLHAIPDIP